MTIIYRVNAGQLPADHWSHDPAEGGGRIIGEACHFIDFVQYLTDALPARVCAAGVTSKRTADYVDDSVVISMSMTDGSIASIIYTASGDKSVAKNRSRYSVTATLPRLMISRAGLSFTMERE